MGYPFGTGCFRIASANLRASHIRRMGPCESAGNEEADKRRAYPQTSKRAKLPRAVDTTPYVSTHRGAKMK
ncbi:uncharacterized protein STEHIDRAFT_144685 [Stereum hirsutum FP-91666 SS1]|uniref:uncharacterized protein n=1 Tax=Stereum hirsutum (strain FP-91666) TaxID=721885 RepID=UPI000440A0E5|nr:uncharacterized protein STEHIDRAFT_144685 [Stereum hirsutum FP-91666 SS1]EIM91369.1 hypothetical protein STEHIDRAFT_144685 [Stereum hirsutum FP-91666 SS1]